MRFFAHPYQVRAMRHIVEHPCCALFLDMGLGKTVVTLTAVQSLIDACEVERVLVVAPRTVAEATWAAEAAKWDHLRSLRVAAVLGTERRRLEALARTADVYVVSRDNFVWLVAHYAGTPPFDMVVLDELTSFKSAKSKRFKAMKVARRTVRRVVGLTGTPSPNGLLDLWAQMYCIDGGKRLGTSLTRYRSTYFTEYRRGNIPLRCTPRTGADETIRRRIADVCLTMRAADYLELPPLLVHDVRVELPAAVMAGYRDFERTQVLEFAAAHAGEPAHVLAASAAGLMNKLGQYANGAVYDDDHTAHDIHAEKLERLAEIVEAAQGAGGVLVFYRFRSDAERILARLKGLRTALYEDARQLEDWNAGRLDVLLAHPASTAYGLNMQQGGHYIVWYGLGWNLEQYQQANARLYRQGQTCPVVVYHLLAADTVDERAAQALTGKSDCQSALLEGLKALMEEYGHGT